MTLLLTFLTAAACLTMAILVYSRNPHHPAHQSISMFSFLLAAWAVSNWLSLQDFSLEQRFFWIRVVMMVTIPIPWFFLRFALHFPISKASKLSQTWHQKIKKLMLVFGTWTVLLMFLSFTPLMFRRYWFEGGQPHLEVGIAAKAYGLTFLVLSTLSTWLIFRTYKLQQGLARLQSAYVLFGIAVAVLIGFSTNFLLVTLFQRFEFVAIGPLSSLFLLGCISYAMLKHRLLDLRLAVLRCTAYVVTLGVITVLYSFALSDMFHQLQGYLPALSERTAMAVGMIGAVLSFPFLNTFIQRLTQRAFYKTAFQPDRAHQILAGITVRGVSLKGLLQELDNFFCTQLGVRWTGILIGKDSHSELVTTLHALTKISFSTQEGSSDSAPVQLIVYDELPEGEVKSFLRSQDIMVAIPLQVHHVVNGWICLGAKHSGDAFSAEELHFCMVAAPQIALALQHVDQLDQMKDEFVSIASHELRTPMTAIRSYLWLCLFKPSLILPDTVREHLQVAYTATERLLELVRDLLTLSQLEAHRLPLRLNRLSLAEITQRVINEIEPLASGKQVRLRLHVALADTFCIFDSNKITEVLHNLMSNAVKFSPKDSTITVTVGGNHEQLSVAVQDNGPGISTQDQAQLFQKFGVIQNSYRRSPESGTGLGLYIAQQLAKLHGGQISISSQPGKGATFILQLPRQPAPQLLRGTKALSSSFPSTYAQASLHSAY